jgi:hypothetical protein
LLFRCLFFRLRITLGILFTVSPHKNIKKAINNDVLAGNVLSAIEGAQVGKPDGLSRAALGIVFCFLFEHLIGRKAPKQRC